MNDTVKRNITVRVSVEVEASPESVWDYTQDWTRRSEWDRSIKGAEVLQPAPGLVVGVDCGAGTTFQARYKQYERPLRTSLTMTECRPGWMGGGGAWSYEATAQGTTWTQTNTITIHGRWRAWLLGPLMRWVLRRNTRRAMHSAKAHLEQQAAHLQPGSRS